MEQDIRNKTVTVLYSCELCGIELRAVQVSERRSNEDAVDYLEKAAGVVFADHKLKSPHCSMPAITQLRIPYFDGEMGVKED